MFDLLFSITDWLRTTFLLDLAFWITETSFNLFLVTNFWILPAIQVIHILAIAAVFGSSLMIAMHARGSVHTQLSVEQVGARYTKWLWWGLAAVIFSGFLMIMAEPIRNMVNAVFWIKMVLLVITVLITLRFQKSNSVKAAAAGASWQASAGTRSTAIVIMVLWCLIILCGRWIAYVPV